MRLTVLRSATRPPTVRGVAYDDVQRQIREAQGVAGFGVAFDWDVTLPAPSGPASRPWRAGRAGRSGSPGS